MLKPEEVTQYNRALKETEQLTRKLDKSSAALERRGAFNPRVMKENVKVYERFGKQLKETTGQIRELTKATDGFQKAQARVVTQENRLTTLMKQRVSHMERLLALQEKMQQGGGDGGSSGLPSVPGVGGDPSGTGAGAGGGTGGGRSRKWFGRFLKGAIAFGVLRKAGGWLKQSADQGLNTLMENQAARSQSQALTGGRFGRKGEAFARRLAFTTAQANEIYQQTTLATGGGRFSRRDALSNLTMMRGRGLDLGSLLGLQAQARHSGGIHDRVSGDGINRALESAIRRGGFARALGREVSQGLSGLLSQGITSGRQVNVQAVASLYSRFSRGMGRDFQRSPLRSAATLQTLDQMIRAPGGGDAGKAFMLRAVGFGRGKSYYNAQKQLQEGLLQPGTLSKVLQQVHREYGSREQKVRALHALSNKQIRFSMGERLLNLDPSDLQGIQRTLSMKGARREAIKHGNRLSFQRREIYRGEMRAGLRAKADNFYTKAFQAEMKALKIAAKGTTLATKTLKSTISQLNSEFEILKHKLPFVNKAFQKLSGWWRGKGSR